MRPVVVPARGRAIFMCMIYFCCSSSQAAEIIHVWVNAFIPKEHPQLPGYIMRTAAGTYTIKAPSIVALSPSEEERALVGTCFLTDNRSFIPDPLASSRLTVEFDLFVEGRNLSIKSHSGRPVIRAASSTNVECSSGKRLSEKPNKNFIAEVGDVKKSDFVRSAFLKANAGNPYFAVSPKIDITISIQYFVLERTLNIRGTVGNFPSFEGYYRVNNGPPMRILTVGPFGKSTVDTLFDGSLGLNSRNFTQTIKLPRPE
ncbi:DUF3238 domain-containing protein [Stutzerimonas kunmingensis]|uniref:DUF3238 domain-containing protein n=1 Tax=Stutzerimonas stutzeri subgroup TaxID=578833 RepID=UPI0037D29CB2